MLAIISIPPLDALIRIMSPVRSPKRTPEKIAASRASPPSSTSPPLNIGAPALSKINIITDDETVNSSVYITYLFFSTNHATQSKGRLSAKIKGAGLGTFTE